MDLELTDTIYSLLSKSKNPQNLFISVFSQDQDNAHPDLEKLFELFKVGGFNYEKINFKDAKGVGFARHRSQKFLTNKYDFYLQVDSHTQFISDWDEKVVLDYMLLEQYWQGKIILTAYPGTYEYTKTGNVKVTEIEIPSCLRVQECPFPYKYEPKYITYNGGEFGQFHGYFCAGFAFGRSQYFIETPYDENLYFNGEEQTLSIRFYCNDVKLIAPNKNYAFHHYSGTRRSRHWEKTPNWSIYDQLSITRLEQFFNNEPLDGFGITDQEKYHKWIECFVTQREE